MSISLEGFAYGEALDGSHNRSLGFRLVAPESPTLWTSEVEGLARRLQSTPFPDHWPTTELFCSLLLADGRRLIALARYGVEDQTPSRRRGGIELIGLVSPNSVSVTSSLAIYQWLRMRRAATEDLRTLSGNFDLVQVLAEAPSPPSFGEAVPVLPVKLWQDGALLFAASSAGEPDLRLGMLEHSANGNWQWLPLVGPDFPITTYSQRGPIVAWTPHVANLALRLDQSSAHLMVGVPRPRRNRFATVLLLFIVALLGANLYFTLQLDRRLTTERANPAQAVVEKQIPDGESKKEKPTSDVEIVARQMHRHLLDRGVFKDLREGPALKEYERLVNRSDFFKVESVEAKMALGAFSEMATRRSAAQIESLIRGLNQSSKGLDPDVLNLIAQRVYQKLSEEP